MDDNFILPSKMHFPTISNYYIEKIFRVLFDSKPKIPHREIFHTFTSVRQEQKIIQEIIKRSQHFDWMCIFGFLEQKNFKEGHLVLLEEIMFKCLKVNPYKTLQIICKQNISEILWKTCLHHSVFRIIYVVVFAQWQYGNIQNLTEKQQRQLLSMLSDLCRLPQLVFQTEKQAILDNNGDQTLKFRISWNIEHMLQEFYKLIKILPPSATSDILNVLHVDQLVIVFKKGLEKLQQMNLKRDSQLSQSQQQEIDNYEQFLEGIIEILLKAIKIIFHQPSLQYLQSLATKQYHTEIRRKVFQQILNLQIVIKKYLTNPIFTKIPISNGQQTTNIGLFRFKLMKFTVSVLDKISYFSFKQENQGKITLVGKIGLEQVEVNLQKFDPFKIVKLYIPINRWNSIFQQQLIKLVDKALSHQNYYTFFKRIYITPKKQNNPQISSSQKCFSEIFLGILVSQFRNKHFIYLSSLRYTPTGNIQTIYKISQLLLQKCPRQDKNFLMEQYAHFKIFVQEDLSKYSDYLFSNKESYLAGAPTHIENHDLESIKQVAQLDHRRSSNRSLLEIVSPSEQTLKSNTQIHLRLKSNQKNKLDSIQPIKKKRRKQSLTQSNFIKKLEGLISDKSNASHKIIK